MPELIDRQAALRLCIEGDGYDDEGFTEGYNFAVSEIREGLKTLPTIEPEVQHGWWIVKERYNLHGDGYCDCLCSECCHRISRPYGFYPDYCEDCGARMGGVSG